MAGICLSFAGDSVALVVRGKTSHAHEPGKMAQHADCICSNGAPVGFFGEGNGGSSNGSGMGLDGAVYDFAEMGRKRNYYVDGSAARTAGVISTVLHIPCSREQAGRFDAYWAGLDKTPPTFNIVGFNCSTRASGAFRSAGILAGGIPGLDTPDNLYKQLFRQLKGKCQVYSGYVGFSAGGSGYLVTVET